MSGAAKADAAARYSVLLACSASHRQLSGAWSPFTNFSIRTERVETETLAGAPAASGNAPSVMRHRARRSLLRDACSSGIRAATETRALHKGLHGFRTCRLEMSERREVIAAWPPGLGGEGGSGHGGRLYVRV